MIAWDDFSADILLPGASMNRQNLQIEEHDVTNKHGDGEEMIGLTSQPLS